MKKKCKFIVIDHRHKSMSVHEDEWLANWSNDYLVLKIVSTPSFTLKRLCFVQEVRIFSYKECATNDAKFN